MVDETAFTVIIPAHNEEAVIARCLETLNHGRPQNNNTQIIVAANGCSDRTVEIAAAAAPDAIVLDLPVGSKTLAMNAAARMASHFPRIFLDADIRCDYHSLVALAATLREPGVMAASPAIRMDLARSGPLVKSYYRVWLTQPYVRQAMVGSGCFGLSLAGYQTIGDFPDITGDDVWVYTRFAQGERRNINNDAAGRPVSFTVSPPRRITDQIRVETRRRLGNAELLKLYPSPHQGPRTNGWKDLMAALQDGASLADLAVYLATKMIVHMRAAAARKRNHAIVWERDLEARNVSSS